MSVDAVRVSQSSSLSFLLRIERRFRLSLVVDVGFWRVEVDFELGIACGEETEGRRRVCEEVRESMEGVLGMEVEG